MLPQADELSVWELVPAEGLVASSGGMLQQDPGIAIPVFLCPLLDIEGISQQLLTGGDKARIRAFRIEGIVQQIPADRKSVV